MKIKVLIWLLATLPLWYLFYKLGFGFESMQGVSNFIQSISFGMLGGFPEDPVKFISDITGISALQCLIATLTVTPLREHTRFNLIRQRRLLGLFTFFYAVLHLFLYFILDHEMKLGSLWHEAMDKKFIFFGLGAFSLLLFMALTSTKKRFSRFHRWHKIIYLAALFIVFHYYLSQKVLTFTPVIYITVVLLLLGLRFRQKLKRLRR